MLLVCCAPRPRALWGCCHCVVAVVCNDGAGIDASRSIMFRDNALSGMSALNCCTRCHTASVNRDSSSTRSNSVNAWCECVDSSCKVCTLRCSRMLIRDEPLNGVSQRRVLIVSLRVTWVAVIHTGGDTHAD